MSHKSEVEYIAHTHNTARFFVEYRQISLVLLIAVCLWGWYGYEHMPKRKDPSIPVRVAVASATSCWVSRSRCVRSWGRS